MTYINLMWLLSSGKYSVWFPKPQPENGLTFFYQKDSSSYSHLNGCHAHSMNIFLFFRTWLISTTNLKSQEEGSAVGPMVCRIHVERITACGALDTLDNQQFLIESGLLESNQIPRKLHGTTIIRFYTAFDLVLLLNGLNLFAVCTFCGAVSVLLLCRFHLFAFYVSVYIGVCVNVTVPSNDPAQTRAVRREIN